LFQVSDNTTQRRLAYADFPRGFVEASVRDYAREVHKLLCLDHGRATACLSCYGISLTPVPCNANASKSRTIRAYQFTVDRVLLEGQRDIQVALGVGVDLLDNVLRRIEIPGQDRALVHLVAFHLATLLLALLQIFLDPVVIAAYAYEHRPTPAPRAPPVRFGKAENCA
jgi:hypothetical protein